MFGGHECLLELVDEKNCANMVGCRHCENCLHYVRSSYTILEVDKYE
jgi:hypothetical protein